MALVTGCGLNQSSTSGGATTPAITAARLNLVPVSGSGQTALSGSALPAPLVLMVTDAKAGPVAGVPVTFAVVSGGGSLSAATAVTDATGRAQVSLMLGGMGLNTVMATVPNGAAPARFDANALYNGAPLAGSNNPLDVAALAALQANNIEPVGLSSDDEFLRRVTADLIGRLPTDSERAAFVASTSTNKRSAVIDQLLATDDFANHWTSDVVGVWLAVAADFIDDKTCQDFPFDPYLFTYLQQDTPVSQLVQDLATANGPAGAAFDENFAIIYSDTTAIDHLVLAFTGMTAKCARCHDHPLTGAQDDPRWVQDDLYGLYAFIAATPDIATKVNKAGVAFGNPVQPSFVIDGYANAPTGLPTLADPIDVRRAAFGQLLAGSKAFKRGTAHRIWSEIAAPLLNPDQFLAANLAGVQSPQLLAALTQVFIDQGTRLKGTLRVFMSSQLYQLTSSAKDTKADALQGRYVLRRQHAEVLSTGDYAVAGVTTGSVWTSNALQAATTPVLLPTPDIFALNFGYPIRYTTVNNPQRSDQTAMQQELVQLNSDQATSGIVMDPAAQIPVLAMAVDGGKMTFADAVAVLFRAALQRAPTPAEVRVIQAASVGSPSTQATLEDTAVALTGSAEYLFRH